MVIVYNIRADEVIDSRGNPSRQTLAEMAIKNKWRGKLTLDPIPQRLMITRLSELVLGMHLRTKRLV
ncbi:hypothetical protein FACS1894103_6280 [Campylobacterota bacterium]|nr:hypothetical protein FACS1894103_6280 [Campylobacterota bacterium]